MIFSSSVCGSPRITRWWSVSQTITGYVLLKKMMRWGSWRRWWWVLKVENQEETKDKLSKSESALTAAQRRLLYGEAALTAPRYATVDDVWSMHRQEPCFILYFALQSLCNACGIRQRKARRAMEAAAMNSGVIPSDAPSGTHREKKQDMHGSRVPFKKRKQLFRGTNSAALHEVFPQDERDAATLLMALSCGLIRSWALHSLVLFEFS